MGGLRLRAARKDDQATIRRLVKRARINPLGLDWRNFLLAIEEGGTIIGCGQIKRHRDGSRELASLVVREEWRGQGVASTIINTLLPTGEGPIWLMCRAELVSYYRRFGFREVGSSGSLPRYFRWVRRLMKLLACALPRRQRGAIMVRRRERTDRGNLADGGRRISI